MKFSNIFSRLFGKLVRVHFPPFLQRYINNFYVRYFKIDMSEYNAPNTYPTLNALFTRELQYTRCLQNTPFNLVSPTDSLIIESGKIYNNQALQIKGKIYSINELLGEYEQSFNTYSFVNLYLSPRDYHHYHAPCDLEILEARYFSGTLLPVNIPSLQKHNNLYVMNERVVLKVRFLYNQSIAYYVAVGALNVGKMRFCFDSTIQTNASMGNNIYQYKQPIFIQAGEEIGCFEMGSTVVLIAQANFLVKAGDNVKMGQEIATLPKETVL